MAIELATAYVSIVPETTKLEAGLKDAFNGVGRQADKAGTEVGSRLAKTASKALRDGWRPDQDIMAGIPNTKLDRVGARIGQVIGKGVVAGLKANEAGAKFAKGFSDGAGSVGLGKLISGWKSQLSSSNLSSIGASAGRSLMMGVTGAATLGIGAVVGGIGTAITKGFDRLLTIDKSKNKLKALGKSTAEVADIVKTVTDTVTGTPFSLDSAFATAVQAIGAGSEDIGRFMKNVADAAGFAGTDIERMGLIFNQVLAKGKLTGEEMMQLMEAGLPARSWIQKSYNLTTQQFEEMQSKGQITLDMLQKSIEDNASGMAQSLGDTLQGSIDKMQTAIARLGATFLTAIFGGDATEATDTMTDSIQRITDKLNEMDSWVKANGPAIQATFQNIGNAISGAFSFAGQQIESFMSDMRIMAQGLSRIIGGMASVSEFMDRIPGVGGNGQEAATLRQWQQGLMDFANPDVVGQGARPGAQRERRGLPPVGVTPNAADQILGAMGGLSGGNVTGGGILGTAGRGYFNSRAAAAQLDARLIDQTLLAQVPSGVYTQTGAADLTQGLADCSSAVEDLVNLLDGQSTSGRSLSTHNAHEWLTSRGFMPGTAPGAFNVGFNDSHMQATLPGGTNFNWGSNASAANRGIGGSGAFDPSFTARYHRFDTGGVLPPGISIVENSTGKPELVLNPEQQQTMAGMGVDPNTLLHGTGQGAAPGPSAQLMAGLDQQANPGLEFIRSMGFVPAAAGNTGVAGTSSLAGFINMGNQVVSGVIDSGVNIANQAVSAAITGAALSGSFGAAAPAAPLAQMAASYGIQLAGNQAKRVSSYWFQMAGIGADALMEHISPFGMPRWLGYDYTQFAPQLGIQQALTSSVERMGSDAISRAFPQQPGMGPGGPVNPSNLPGAAAPLPPPPEAAPPPAPSGPSNQPAPNAAPPSVVPTLSLPMLPIPGLFDDGGWLPPGGMGVNMTNRPEPVLSPQQWDAIAASSSEPNRSAPLVNNLYAQDMTEAIRKLEQTKRRDMMQYAGRS